MSSDDDHGVRGSHADAATVGEGASDGERKSDDAAGRSGDDGDNGSRERRREKKKLKKERKKREKMMKASRKSFEKFKETQERRGVVYLSRIPPYMKPAKVRHLLEQYGLVTNVYCVPEDASIRRRRRKSGGNSKTRYVEGWVEYADKKIARRVARTLNNRIVGGKKSSYYHDDIWNIKYLRGFKWRHLTEKMAYERRIRDQRLRAEITKAKEANNAYVAQVERAREIRKMEERRVARNGRKGGGSDAKVAVEREKIRRSFRQKAPVSSDARPQLTNDILSSVFSGKRSSSRGISESQTDRQKKRRRRS